MNFFIFHIKKFINEEKDNINIWRKKNMSDGIEIRVPHTKGLVSVLIEKEFATSRIYNEFDQVGFLISKKDFHDLFGIRNNTTKRGIPTEIKEEEGTIELEDEFYEKKLFLFRRPTITNHFIKNEDLKNCVEMCRIG